MFNTIKKWFNKPSQVKVLVTFPYGTQIMWVSYGGMFNANNLADYVFEQYPTATKVKILDN